MDCRDFEHAFDDLTLGLLGAGERRACERHAAVCDACSELMALASLAARAETAPPDLAAAVLARTSGAPCEGAESRLPELVDGALEATQRELVTAHLKDCPKCSGLAATLGALARQLPSLAVVEPDSSFVGEVLRRTLPVHVQLRRWWARTWPGWLRRPRFASEAAYVGLLVLVLIFATPGSPLEAVPRQALAAARQPARMEGGFGDALRTRAAEARALVEVSGGRALESAIESWTATAWETAGRVRKLAAQAGDELATLWREAASLLANDGGVAAPDSSDSTEENR